MVWIYSGVIFLLFAYTTKMNTFMHNTYEIEHDSNPWNNKDTEDFLRHLKREYFTMTYTIAFVFMEVTLGFTDFFDINSYGPRDFGVSGVCMIIAMLPRIFNIILMSVFSICGFDASSPQMNCYLVTEVIINVITLNVFVILQIVMKDQITD